MGKPIVGILTFPNTNNYGAELQAFALCSTVRRMGHEVELVDYRNPMVTFAETPRRPGVRALVRHPRGSLARLLALRGLVARQRGFNAFRSQHQTLGPRMGGQQDMARRYETVVVGSDQVWNPEITGADPTYLLADPSMSATRKVSYAASFGYEDVPAAWRRPCGEALRLFDAISVREEAGAGIVRELAGRQAQVVLDPTLLLGRDEWACLAGPRLLSGDYVLAYVVAERDKTLRHAREAARRMGAALVVVECYGHHLSSPHGRGMSGASPQEFLSLVRDARLVVTSSFHGLALALSLGSEVRFSLSDEAANKNSRLVTLARLAGIEGHSVDVMPAQAPDEPAGACPAIDYERVDTRLAEARRRSLAFLADSLSGGAR